MADKELSEGQIAIRFITGIRWYKGMLETLNNMTYIYDVNWNPNNSNKATFPVCFFHVKNMHEIMNTEISQKQMLFYNSSIGANSSDPSASSGLLNVVSDNIVIKPKVYKLDVVIPYRNLSLLEQSFVYNTHTAQAVTEAIMGGDKKVRGMDRLIASNAMLVQPYLKLLKSIITSLVSLGVADSGWIGDSSGINDWVESTLHKPDFNKESLEMMWRMRHIVKMKVWNSWRYKYVAIVDIDITKEGTEDGVYEATLTLQEMPIMAMHAQKVGGKKNIFQNKNPLLRIKGESTIKILDWAGGNFSKGE